MTEIARKFVIWKGRKVPLVRDNGGLWRLRSRSKYLNVDISTGTVNETTARQVARRLLDEGVATENPKRGPAGASLQTLVDVYLATPKRVAKVSAASNVNRLAKIVRLVYGKRLDEVKVKEATAELWQKYQSARYAALGRTLDYTQRIPENAGINAAVRAARSVFIHRLRPAYERAGLAVPEDADNVTWLPEPILVRPPADDAGLVAAWLEREQDALWFVVGLARFAGMRLAEIGACRREWIAETAGVVSVEMRDRPAEGFQHKVGRPYLAPVLHPVLAAALVACPPGLIVNPSAPARLKWLDVVPQQWARQFVGPEVRKPVHRLRGLYATDLADRTRLAVAAQLAGEQAAASALGHTSPETTRRHYL